MWKKKNRVIVYVHFVDILTYKFIYTLFYFRENIIKIIKLIINIFNS